MNLNQTEMISVPETIKKGVLKAAKWVGVSTNDWGTIKFQITNTLSNQDRKRFGKRHYSTKLLILNEMDVAVMRLWEEATGVTPIVPPDKLHKDKEVQKPRWWGIEEFNEKRKQQNA